MDSLPSHHYDGAILIAPKAEEAYFSAYRLAYPKERFDVFDFASLEALFQYDLSPEAEEELVSLGVARKDLPLTITILKRLRFAPKIAGLASYFSFAEELKKKGLLRVLCDPFAYFKGRMIIVRGYHDGRGISEVLQDLPNICVNFDFGQDRPSLIPPKRIAISELGRFLETAPRPLCLVCAEEDEIPETLKALPRLIEPYAPSEGGFVLLESDRPYFRLEPIPLPPPLLKALRLPDERELRRRYEVELSRLLSSARLLATIG